MPSGSPLVVDVAPRAGRRHEHPHDGLAREVAEVEAALLAQALVDDAASGLVPSWARRGLHPHELAARVSFAAIDQHENNTTGLLVRRLTDDREAFLRLLVADLEQQPTGRAVVDRLLELETAGIVSLDGAGDLLQASVVANLDVLTSHAMTAAALARQEAQLQGIGIGPVALAGGADGQLQQLAQRLAVAPHVDLIRFLRDEAIRLPTPPSAPPLAGVLADHGRGLSTAPLEEQARNAVNQADGLGRQATADTAPPAQIYASELLDGNTCGPCSFVDGTSYPNLGAARLDYPAGNYIRCEGGARCRGTLVFVWAEQPPPF